MKRLIIYICLFSLVIFTGCNKDNSTIQPEPVKEFITIHVFNQCSLLNNSEIDIYIESVYHGKAFIDSSNYFTFKIENNKAALYQVSFINNSLGFNFTDTKAPNNFNEIRFDLTCN